MENKSDLDKLIDIMVEDSKITMVPPEAPSVQIYLKYINQVTDIITEEPKINITLPRELKKDFLIEKLEEWIEELNRLSENSRKGIIHDLHHSETQRLIKVRNSKETWRIEDWWDRVVGKSWKLCVDRPGIIMYFCRIMDEGISTNDEVIYCSTNTGNLLRKSALIHESEILEYM